MATASARPATDETLLREASRWFVRIHDDSAEAEDFTAWQAWLAQDAAHQAAFQSVEDFWQVSGGIENPPWPEPSEWDSPATKVKGALNKPKNRFALAAAILLSVGLTSVFLYKSSKVPILPDTAAVKTAASELREYRLPDGSRLTVSAQSRVTINFTAHSRRLIIDAGEAYFDVARDAQRPFVVHAGSGSITALGTAFNVRTLAGRVVVTVVEGRVEVADLQASASPSASFARPLTRAVTQLGPGQEIAYGSAPEPLRRVDSRIATAWRDGQLRYLHEPLKFVIADVARYTERQLILADAEAGEMLYTGTVLPDELDDWLQSVADALPVELERLNGGAVLLKSRAAVAAP